MREAPRKTNISTANSTTQAPMAEWAGRNLSLKKRHMTNCCESAKRHPNNSKTMRSKILSSDEKQRPKCLPKFSATCEEETELQVFPH